MSELSTKPYLIRALYEWCTDCGYTPYLAVSVDDFTQVPREYVKNGEIVLNISALATSKLQLGNEFIEFQARFGGIARQISVPIGNISAIYARETGHGMAFEVTRLTERPDDSTETARATGLSAVPGSVTAPSEIKLVHEQPSTAPSEPPKSPGPGDAPKGKPQLKIVK